MTEICAIQELKEKILEDIDLNHEIEDEQAKVYLTDIRVGIEKDFLTISTNPISDYNTVGIRYYLHGAIVGSFEKSIYKSSSENSLTHLLEETGCIHRNKFSDPYSINKVPDSGTEIRGVHVAKQLGLTLGKLLEKDNAKITLDELILLSTCPYVIDVIGAMAAEIHIFQGFYYYRGQHYFKNYNSVDKECFATKRVLPQLIVEHGNMIVLKLESHGQ